MVQKLPEGTWNGCIWMVNGCVGESLVGGKSCLKSKCMTVFAIAVVDEK